MANHTKGRTPPNKTAAPARDKVFQEKVRKAKGKRPKGRPVTIDVYNAMYAAYMEQQSARYVAEQCGVDRRTALRYVDKGDPKRNLRPLKDRFDAVQTQAQTKQDYDLARARSEVQGAARVMLARVAQRIASVDPAEIDANRLATILKDTQVVLERTLGVADASVDVRAEGRFAHWTLEELIDFATKGVAPEHDRSTASTSSTTYKQRG